MNAFAQTTISIRGESYTVRELTGKEMQGVRKLAASDTEKVRVEAFVTHLCCIEPKYKTEAEAAELPQIVVDRVSAEAFRLTRGGDELPKEGEEQKV